MTQALFLELAGKSLLAGGAAFLLLLSFGRRSASERSFVAHLGLGAMLAVPLLGLMAPQWSLAMSRPDFPDPAPALGRALAATTAVPHVEVPSSAMDAGTALRLVYALPMLALLLATIVAVLRLLPLRRRATIVVEQPWLRALALAQQRMGFKNGAALLLSDDIRSPVSWGLIRPTIVVDADTLLNGSEAEAIIAHELAHVARFDWMKLLLARGAVAMLWFNPFAWILARRCHHLREEAADDAVLRSDIDRADYAALLVNAARRDAGRQLLAANGVTPAKGSLRRRITRVLDASLGRSPARIGWSLGCMAIGAAIGAPLAALTLQPIAAAAPDVASRHPARVAVAETARAAIAPLPSAPLRVVTPNSSVRRTETPLAALPVASIMPPAPPAPPVTAPERLPLGVAILSASPASRVEVQGSDEPYGFGQTAVLRSLGATPAWLREMGALGYRDLPFDTVVSLTAQGVTPGYVRAMAAAGYPGLSTSQLVAMRIHGVSPNFAARMARSRSPKPRPERLIEAAIMGGDPLE